MAQTSGGDAANRRREGRVEVNLAASLHAYRSERQVRIRDLSASGAMVGGDDLPAKGDEVVLRRGSMQVVATVVWSLGENCGLSFHRAIDPRALIRADS